MAALLQGAGAVSRGARTSILVCTAWPAAIAAQQMVRVISLFSRRHQSSQPAPGNGGATTPIGIASLRRVAAVLCIDANGKLSESRYQITQLKEESRLHMRELLVMEQPSALMQPRIMPRRHCIVMTIGFVRAIVWPDRVYLFSPQSPQVQKYARTLAAHIVHVYGSAASSSGAADAAANGAAVMKDAAAAHMTPTEHHPSYGAEGNDATAATAAMPGVEEVVNDDTAAHYDYAHTVADTIADGGADDVAAATGPMAGEPVLPVQPPPARGGRPGRGFNRTEDGMAFELIVMEHALLTIQARQAKRVAYARHVLDNILSKMSTVEKDDGRLYALFPLANTLTHYEMVCRGLMECVRALLDDDRDMREACLTEKARLSHAVTQHAVRTSMSSVAAYNPEGEHSSRRMENSMGGLDAATTAHASSVHAEGPDAYLGHAVSPIGTHRHIVRVLRSQAVLDDAVEEADEDSRERPSSRLQPPRIDVPASIVFPALPRSPATMDDDDAARNGGRHGRGPAIRFDAPRRSNDSVTFGRRARMHDDSQGLPAVLRVSHDALSHLELMLESVYHLSAETTMNIVELSRTLKNKQDLLELQQSNFRNYILSVSLRMSVLGVAVSTATFVTSAFGMNLPSALEGVPGLFYVATGTSALLGVYFYRLVDRFLIRSSPTQQYARRLQAFQELMWTLDTKIDAARNTLSMATAAPPPPFSARLMGNEYAAGDADTGIDHMELPSDLQRAAASRTADGRPSRISKKEFKTIYETTSARRISDEEVDVLFELLDADADGALRVEEVLSVGVLADPTKHRGDASVASSPGKPTGTLPSQYTHEQ